MVKVKVLEVDVARKRIALSMKRNSDDSSPRPVTKKPPSGQQAIKQKQSQKQQPATQGTMANAFAQALKK